MTKTKKIAIAAAVIAALIFAAFFFTVWSARKASQAAIDAYNAAAEKYNEEISPYNEAVNQIASENEELQKILDRAKADVDSGDAAYKPETLEDLKKELEKAQKLPAELPALIDPFDKMAAPAGFSKKELNIQQQEAEASLEAVKEAEANIPETPEVPDFSEAENSLLEKCEAYEKSVRMLKNVTSPEDSFVKERLGKVDTIVGTGAVTKEYDPNGLLGKKGGYTGCVYFLDERIDREQLPSDDFRKPGQAAPEEESTAGGTESEAAEEGMTGTTGETAAEEASTGETAAAADTAEQASTGETASEADTAERATTGETAAAADTAEKAATGETAAAADTAEQASTGETASSADTTERATTGETAAAADTAERAATGETAAAADAAGGEPLKDNPDAIMIGTAGGGAVEIFSSREDAEARMEYLAFFDGSVMAAGSYDIEGTCVIRTSKYLSEEQQKELTKKIREALLEVD